MDTERFIREASADSSESFHRDFRCCLHGLYEQGIFQFDHIQPSGPSTPLASTRVTRCLVGQPGITYKYLGLRMFAHPWKGPKASEYCRAMYVHNKEMIAKAEQQAGKVGCGELPHTCKFNLTLINRMDPKNSAPPDQLGAVSVSWHADSSLLDFSTISVYVAEHAATKSSFGLTPKRPHKPRNDPWYRRGRHVCRCLSTFL